MNDFNLVFNKNDFDRLSDEKNISAETKRGCIVASK